MTKKQYTYPQTTVAAYLPNLLRFTEASTVSEVGAPARIASQVGAPFRHTLIEK